MSLAVLAAGQGARAQNAAPLPLPAPVTDMPLPPIFQPFKVDRSNRVAVEVRINGSGPYHFIVDTGAERSVISNELAQGLSLEAGPALGLATIAGRHVAPSFHVEHLATDSFAIQNLQAPALKRGDLGANGLIGLDGLDGHRVVMDFGNDRMSVEKTGRRLRPGVAADGTIVVQAERMRGRMVIHQARINGITVDLIIDTGASTSIGNIPLRAALQARKSTKQAEAYLLSVTGERIRATVAIADRIKIGGATIENLPISFADAYAFKVLNLDERPALLLGMDVIGLFEKVTIDFDKRQVQFGIREGAAPGPRGLFMAAADPSGLTTPLPARRGAAIER